MSGKLNPMCMQPCGWYKTLLFSLLLGGIIPSAQCQEDSTFNAILKSATDIESDTSLNLNDSKYRRVLRKSAIHKDSLRNGERKFVDKNVGLWASYLKAADIRDYLYELENDNYSETALTDKSNQIIQHFNNLASLSLILRHIIENTDTRDGHNQLIRKKLIHAISSQMQIIGDNTQAWYNYSTIEKRWLKGIQLEKSNDLLTFGIFQKNNDMDYTGSLKLSLITDMFKLDIGQPTQSYQAITYGGEVYTPYFKDTNIFVKEDTFNIYDRPHGCFQYIGFENHGIAKHFKSRWSTNFKIGAIGGRFGYNFQFFLHRDISLSPYPTGWDAQVAYPGRLAIQLNGKYEHLFIKEQANYHGGGFKLVPSWSAEIAFGSFMTYGEVGFNLSTQNFKYKNQNNSLPRTRYTNRNERVKKVRGYADLDLSARFVGHNTMLQGFGWVQTNELKDESFATASSYVLDRDRIFPVVIFTSLTGGIQFPNFNLFYQYNVRSPEFRSDGIIKTNDGKELDPNKRWHHYSKIGVTIIL